MHRRKAYYPISSKSSEVFRSKPWAHQWLCDAPDGHNGVLTKATHWAIVEPPGAQSHLRPPHIGPRCDAVHADTEIGLVTPL